MIALLAAAYITAGGTAPAMNDSGSCRQHAYVAPHPSDSLVTWHTKIGPMPIPFTYIVEDSGLVKRGDKFHVCYDVTGSLRTFWIGETWISRKVQPWQAWGAPPPDPEYVRSRCRQSFALFKHAGVCQ